MNCDDARSNLFELVEDAGGLAPAEREALQAHVAGCPSCSADVEAIRIWRQHARAWQDEPAPRWNRARIERPAWRGPAWRGPAWRDWRGWFPVAASTAALALAVIAVVGPGPATESNAPAPAVATYDPELQRQLVDAALAQFREELDSRRETDRSFVLQAVLDAARDQREEELTALAVFLKAEMDRRSLETDESLRYLITDQVRDRRRLEDLFQRVGTRRDTPENRR